MTIVFSYKGQLEKEFQCLGSVIPIGIGEADLSNPHDWCSSKNV